MLQKLVDLLSQALPLDVVTKTLSTLTRDVAAPFIVKEVGHGLLKGIDDVVVAAVKNLPTDKAQALTTEYAGAIEAKIGLLIQAITAYIPHQIAVEVAKKEHGTDSAEANAARADRATYINEVHADIAEIFTEITGEHVEA